MLPSVGLRGRRRRGVHDGEEVMGARQRVVATVTGFALVALTITIVVATCQTGRAQGLGAIGGPFTLVDDNGAPVTEKTLTGKPYIMYFGYTYCPDICPTTLVELSRWIKELGPDANKLNYV